MASPIPVTNFLNQAPDFLRTAREGYQYGQQKQDDVTIRGLAPGVVAGDPAAYNQAAALDPKRAGALQDAGDANFRRLKGALNFIDQAKASGNQVAIQAAWKEVAPFIGQVTGKPMPQEYPVESEAAFEQLKARIAMAESGGAGDDLKSLRVGGNGNYWAIRGGQLVDTGTPAPPQNQIIAVQQPDGSVQYQSVNKATANPTATPVTTGAPPAAGGYAPPALGTRTISNFQAKDESTGQAITDPAELAEIQAAILASEGGGNQIQTPSVLTGAPAPRAPSDQWVTMTSDETSAAGLPAGTFAQRNLKDNSIKVGPASAQPNKPTAVERKTILAAKAKYPQLQNAIRGLDRIENAMKAIKGLVIDTGPVDQYVSRYTPEGQELEKAVGAIQNSFLALTRVPGIGSQSDLEARIAAMQYPSLDAYPQNNQNTMTQLRAFAEDLRRAYDTMLEQDDTPEAGTVMDGYRFKGGDPADPENWEAQ